VKQDLPVSAAASPLTATTFATAPSAPSTAPQSPAVEPSNQSGHHTVKSGRSATFSGFDYVRRLFTQESSSGFLEEFSKGNGGGLVSVGEESVSGSLTDSIMGSLDDMAEIIGTRDKDEKGYRSGGQECHGAPQDHDGNHNYGNGNAYYSGTTMGNVIDGASSGDGPSGTSSNNHGGNNGDGNNTNTNGGNGGSNPNNNNNNNNTTPSEPPPPPGPISCTCASHLEHPLTDTTFNVDIQTLINLIFGEGGTPVIRKTHKVRETENLHFGSWQTDASTQKWKTRELHYNPSFKMPMMAKTTTPATESQNVLHMDPYRATVETYCKTPKVPYGEFFTVVNRYCLTHQGPGKSRLLMTAKVDTVKKLMWKERIENGAMDGSKAFAAELVKVLKSQRPSRGGGGVAGGETSAVETDTGAGVGRRRHGSRSDVSDAEAHRPPPKGSMGSGGGGVRSRKTHKRVGSRHSGDGVVGVGVESSGVGGTNGGDDGYGNNREIGSYDDLGGGEGEIGDASRNKTWLDWTVSFISSYFIARPLFVVVWITNMFFKLVGLPLLHVQDVYPPQDSTPYGPSSQSASSYSGYGSTLPAHAHSHHYAHKTSSTSGLRSPSTGASSLGGKAKRSNALKRKSGDYSLLSSTMSLSPTKMQQQQTASPAGPPPLSGAGGVFMAGMLVSLVLGALVTGLNVYWMSKIGERLDKALMVVKLLKAEKAGLGGVTGAAVIGLVGTEGVGSEDMGMSNGESADNMGMGSGDSADHMGMGNGESAASETPVSSQASATSIR
jgi:hypothetical protein